MRIGELRTVEWLEETAAIANGALFSTLATRPELQGMFADAPLESVVFVDEVYDGWQVIYLKAPIDCDEPNAELAWFAEATEADTLEAKGFFATVAGKGAGEWTPTHGDHGELEAEQEALAPVAEAVPGMAFAGGGSVAPVQEIVTLVDIRQLQAAIAEAERAIAKAQPGAERRNLREGKMRLMDQLNQMLDIWFRQQGIR